MMTCSCCGAWVSEKDNTAPPGKYDVGYGMCKGCGGDSSVPIPEKLDEMTEEAARKLLGWARCQFAEARFSVLRNALSEENRKKFDGLSFVKKVLIIERSIEDGMMSW